MKTKVKTLHEKLTRPVKLGMLGFASIGLVFILVSLVVAISSSDQPDSKTAGMGWGLTGMGFILVPVLFFIFWYLIVTIYTRRIKSEKKIKGKVFVENISENGAAPFYSKNDFLPNCDWAESAIDADTIVQVVWSKHVLGEYRTMDKSYSQTNINAIWLTCDIKLIDTNTEFVDMKEFASRKFEGGLPSVRIGDNLINSPIGKAPDLELMRSFIQEKM